MNPRLRQLNHGGNEPDGTAQLDGPEQPNVSDRHPQTFELADSAGTAVDPFRD